jgi:hypothetical protein
MINAIDTIAQTTIFIARIAVTPAGPSGAMTNGTKTSLIKANTAITTTIHISKFSIHSIEKHM